MAMLVRRASGVALVAVAFLMARGPVDGAAGAQDAASTITYTNITGTWSATLNGTRNIQAVLKQQPFGGIGKECAPVTGTMDEPGQAWTVLGFYCVDDRQLRFTRSATGTSKVEYYLGYVSEKGSQMAGSLHHIGRPPSGSAIATYEPWSAER